MLLTYTYGLWARVEVESTRDGNHLLSSPHDLDLRPARSLEVHHLIRGHIYGDRQCHPANVAALMTRS